MANVAQVLKPESRETNKMDTGLSEAYRDRMAGSLSDILASIYRLTIKSHIYHWNVVGPLFKSLHELTEEHYGALFDAADVVAERIRALGHLAPAKMSGAADFAPKPSAVNHASAGDMVADLIADHESAVRAMRAAAAEADDADDLVTSDMLTDYLNFHEKALWMLRAIIAN